MILADNCLPNRGYVRIILDLLKRALKLLDNSIRWESIEVRAIGPKFACFSDIRNSLQQHAMMVPADIAICGIKARMLFLNIFCK